MAYSSIQWLHFSQERKKEPTVFRGSSDGDLHARLRGLDGVFSPAQAREVGEEHVRLSGNPSDGGGDQGGRKHADRGISMQTLKKFVLLIGS